MNRLAISIASILSALVILALVGASVWRRTKALEAERAALSASNEQQAHEIKQLRDSIAEQDELLDFLLLETEEASHAQKSLEEEMRATLQSKDVTISELKGKLTVNILDRILFDSGEADLKPEGEQLLTQIAGVLGQHTNHQVHVIGHTDNVPIYRRFGSNWELSAARAIAAVRFLQEHTTVDPRQLAAVACGEFRPIAPNTSPEGRAKNRRIEVVVLPLELATPREPSEMSGDVSTEKSVTPAPAE